MTAAAVDDRPLRSIPPSELASRVHLRVLSLTTLSPAQRSSFGYARRVSDDLIEVLALDSPASVRLLLDSDLVGADLHTFRLAGLENLLRTPIDVVDQLQVRDGVTVHWIMAESPYTAGRILALPDLLGRIFGPRAYAHGVLVAVPVRHKILIHPMDTIESIHACNAMAALAVASYEREHGPLSPFLHWWCDGHLTQISRLDVHGRPEIHVEGRFVEALNALAG